MVKKYIKKPLVIEAVQWMGHNSDEVLEFTNITNFGALPTEVRFDGVVLQVNTLEGIMAATPGDYIIRGIEGEYYPCKPEIFEKTYDEVA